MFSMGKVPIKQKNTIKSISRKKILHPLPLTIPTSHPTFLIEKQVNDFCTPFFDAHGFNYFQYARMYSDGSISVLFNNANLFRHLVDLDYPSFSSFKEEEHQRKQAYWFLWDEELPWLPVKMARDCHNLHHGLTLLRRSKNYYDMIAVALSNAKINAASYYLNKFQAIEYFIQSFEKNNTHLLHAVNSCPIQCPEHNRDRNLYRILNPTKRIKVLDNAYITAQELSCLRLLLSGLTYKEIGQMLELSPRSVETYIARAKLRTGKTTKSALRDMLSTCP